MAKERKEILVLDGLTILFIVTLVINGVLAALIYRWHSIQVFKENISHQKVYSDLLETAHNLKAEIIKREGAESWNDSGAGKTFAFRERGRKMFTSHGISMDYPGDYASEVSSDGTHLTLMTKEDAERLRDPRSSPTEGPPTITMNTFSLGGKNLLDWLKSTPESNFAISNGEYTKTVLNNIPTILYRWSGLYEAIVYAIETNDKHVVLLTVTYITRSDDIVRDFDLIVSTLKKG
jgi:hypothetical protein